MAIPDTEDDMPDLDSRWQSYSDYSYITRRVAKIIQDAIDGYARLDARHHEGAIVDADFASEVRGRLITAAITLLPEMQREADRGLIEDTLDRWTDNEEADEPGFISRLSDVNLRTTCPGWLLRFAIDLRQMGWELGYLQAGESEYESPDDPERKAKSFVK